MNFRVVASHVTDGGYRNAAIPRYFATARQALRFANRSFGVIETLVNGEWRRTTRALLANPDTGTR